MQFSYDNILAMKDHSVSAPPVAAQLVHAEGPQATSGAEPR